MNAVTLTILISITGAAGEKLADDLVDLRIERVGVLPVVISRKGDHESTAGPLGPRALTIARDLRMKLVTLSSTGRHRGKFSVVSDQLMKEALREADLDGPITVEDLGDISVLQALSRYTGAGAFLTLDNELIEVGAGGQRPKPRPNPVTEVTVGVVRPDGTEPLRPKKWYDANSLGEAAYMGHSFELRRWDGDTLLNQGIVTPHSRFEEDSHWEFGKGEKWEELHVRHLKQELPHPLSLDAFPYPVTIKVDGERRELQRLGDEYVVALEDGEEYAIELANETDQPPLAEF